MDKFVEGMSLRGESLLAFQNAYPGLNLALIILGGVLVLGLLVWALVNSRSDRNSQDEDG